MKDFLKKYPEIYLPFVREKFGVSDEELTEVVCSMWDTFENPAMVENTLVKNNKIDCKYYETCDTKYQRGKTIPSQKIWDYCRYNSGVDQHISVFRHDELWYNNAQKTNSVSCSGSYVSCDWIYLELDRRSYKEALRDAQKIWDKFPYKDSMVLWCSGNRSIHIAVHASLFGYPTGKQEKMCGIGRLYYNIAHKIAGDVRHNNGIIDPWLLSESEVSEAYTNTFDKELTNIQEAKQELENIDPNLFRVNSLIRQPWSLHEKTNQIKTIVNPITGKKKNKKILDFKKNNPYLIHWVNECYEPKYKREPITKSNVDEGVIQKIFSDIEGFSPSDADRNGWINNLYSPFYEDSNPSVAVNIKTGIYKDHGNPTHTFGLIEFVSKINNIDDVKAKRFIKNLRKDSTS